MPPLANSSIPPATQKRAHEEEQATTTLILSNYNLREFNNITAARENPNY